MACLPCGSRVGGLWDCNPLPPILMRADNQKNVKLLKYQMLLLNDFIPDPLKIVSVHKTRP